MNKLIAEALNSIEASFNSYFDIINDYKKERNSLIVSWESEAIPPELTAPFNIISLKIPSFISLDSKFISLVPDAFITFKGHSIKGIPATPITLHEIQTPGGYGEDTAVTIHNETAAFLKNSFNIDIKTVDIEILKEKTGTYERLRRDVRTICSLRNMAPRLLTHKDMAALFETALIFPPEIAITLIEPLLMAMQKSGPQEEKALLKAMIFSMDNYPAEAADKIENEGILIIEDDSPWGRRSFDISLDHRSDYVFYEILDAYSYRPWAPGKRNSRERYDLLYRLLGNYGIELIVFIEPDNRSDYELIDYLRIRSMRNGIDSITGPQKKIVAEARDYLTKAGISSLALP